MHLYGRLIVPLLSLALVGAPAARAQDAAPAQPFACAAPPPAVVSLAIGSRYQADSATRSAIAEQSNADVDRALEPVEDYINALSTMANAAHLGGTDSQANADCVLDWLQAWAAGDALTDLASLNARLAVSPRLAGMALAYLQAQPVATPEPRRDDAITAWLQGRATAVIDFFGTEAGPLASTNNLRAWATLATAAVGQIAADRDMLAWSRESYQLLVCGAEASGALPAEMERGERALHYQLHAVAPLVVAITLLDPDGVADDELCRAQLEQIARFTLAGVADPTLVGDLVGSDQVFSGDDETVLAPYQLAWAEVYLARYPDAALEADIEALRPLRYSKLGGNLTAVYGPPTEPQ